MEERSQSYLPQYNHHHAGSVAAESFTFDNANGTPQPEGFMSPGVVRAGRIDEQLAAPQGPDLERQSGQDVSPASSMTGSFTAEKEEALSSRAQRKFQELRDLFKLSSDEVGVCSMALKSSRLQQAFCLPLKRARKLVPHQTQSQLTPLSLQVQTHPTP